MLEIGYTQEEAMEGVHSFSRDSARTPMQWTGGKNAGFTTGEPWLPLNENYKTVNVESEEKDSDSVLSWYHTLSDLRSLHEELTAGSYEEILHEDEQIYAFIRETEAAKSVVLTNFSEKEAEYDPSIVDGAKLLISSVNGGRYSWTPGAFRICNI